MLAEHTSPDRPARDASDRTDAELSADELEQRQRPDGTFDEPTTVGGSASDPLTPDELEQRQRADGSYEDVGTVDDPSSDPLTPDELEQRGVLEDDDEEPPVEDDEEYPE